MLFIDVIFFNSLLSILLQNIQVIRPYVSSIIDLDAYQSASFHEHQEELFFTSDPVSPPEDDITNNNPIKVKDKRK